MKRLLLVVAALFLSVFCWAHDPQLSGIGIVTNGDQTTIAVQVHLARLGAGDPVTLIAKRLDLTLNGAAFIPKNAKIVIDKGQDVAYWTASYPNVISTFTIGKRLFPEDSGTRTIVSVTQNGVDLQETILDASHGSLTFGGTAGKQRPEGTWKIIAQFWQLGLMHIFTGPDHILFILGLILMGGGLRALLKTVTAFTVAHSITLTIAATGLWTPASRYVEPLIALSIVAVAFENLRGRKGQKDWRPLIAFAFGLIHGFGFAGGLAEAGLPHGMLGWALASFNIGVETAQASIVLLTVPVLALIAKWKPIASHRIITVGSLAIAFAGAVWFIDRVRIV
jgi:hypothetical protein